MRGIVLPLGVLINGANFTFTLLTFLASYLFNSPPLGSSRILTATLVSRNSMVYNEFEKLVLGASTILDD